MEIITDKEVQVTSGGSVTVDSGDRISMTSANDFRINAGKNLSITVADFITMTCRENIMKFETPAAGIELGSSIKLNEDIDMKAKLIKEKIIKKSRNFSQDKNLGIGKLLQNKSKKQRGKRDFGNL